MNNVDLVSKIKKNPFIRFLFLPYILTKRKVYEYRIEKKEKRLDRIFNKFKSGKIVMRVDEFNGDFEIDIRSHLFKRIIYEDCYEPALLKLVNKYLDPDKDVIDIGANIGFYSVYFSKMISSKCKILSVEPIPSAYNSLVKNVGINESTNKIYLYNGIASDRTDSFQINYIDGKEEYSSIGDMIHDSVKGEKFETMAVEGDTIDNLVERFGLKPGFLKIDTEGSEYRVLKGSKSTLETYKPVILSELSERLLNSQQSSTLEVFNLLREMKYKIFNADFFGEVINIPFEGNILAVHEDYSKK